MTFSRPCFAMLLSALLLGACATITRPHDGLAPPGSALHMVDPRVDAATLTEDFTRRLEATDKPLTLLSLSGGGANGAYGAGVIVGWTKAGQRPEFSVVTGVSTGALAAPFVFLGPEWDDELETAYARGAAEGLIGWSHLAFLVSPSLFSARQLRHLVYDNVTPELLRAVAVENARGRRLLVATTSIPAVVPPVFIVASGEDGRLLQQMHVDGGVNTPFLAVPEDMLLWTSPAKPPPGSVVYILVNGILDREHSVTRGSLMAILRRTMASSGNASTRIHLAANVAFAHRNGMGLRLASIPKGTPASLLNFSEGSMSALFEKGRADAAAGLAWADVASEERTPQDASKPPAPPR
jgi:hypothetical protein